MDTAVPVRLAGLLSGGSLSTNTFLLRIFIIGNEVVVQGVKLLKTYNHSRIKNI